MRVRMLRGRKLVHLASPDSGESSGYLVCPYEGYHDFHFYGPVPWRNAERVADDEPLTCKLCLKIANEGEHD